MAAITDSEKFMKGGQKFNFVCSKRTFSLLVSPYFDKFTENLICEEIVLKMGLPIFDRKCETLSISGVKTEAVGYIKTTVQCLKSGFKNGTIYIKAKVVRNFYSMFGSDGLCSEQLRNKLTSPAKINIVDSATESNDESKVKTEPTPNDDESLEATPKFTKNKKKKPNISLTSPSSPTGLNNSPYTPSPPLYPETKNVNSPPKTPILPPGFSYPFLPKLRSKPPHVFPPPKDNTPPTIVKVPFDLPMSSDTAMMSPLSANISRLTATFGDTDIMDNFVDKRANLTKLDPDGKCVSRNGVSFAFYKSRAHTSSPSVTHSAVFRSGHGRDFCSTACKDSDLISHNCGHHSQWQLPADFQDCSTECKGGLCRCLRDYAREYEDYGYYG